MRILKTTIDRTYIEESRKSGLFSYICAGLCLLTMPIYNGYLPPLMALWMIVWSWENYDRINEVWKTRSLFKFLFLVFCISYAIQLIGLIYSRDLKLGFSNAFGRLSFLIFPLVLFSPGTYIKTHIRTLIKIFVIGTVIYLLFCYSHAFIISISIHDGKFIFRPHDPKYDWINYFYSTELVVGQHPSYTALYVILSMLLAFDEFFENRKNGKAILWLCMAIFLFITTYFLSSRSGILSGVLLIIIYFSLKVKNVKYRFFIVAGILISMTISLPFLQKNLRFRYLYNKFLNKENVDGKIEEPRTIIWPSAIEIIKNNFFTGVGIGDVRDELSKQYTKAGRPDMAESRLNAHNQFLEVFVENGIIGFICFTFLIGFMFFISISDKNLVYFLYVFMILIFFTFETVLYRFAGISFFSLFSFLLLHLNPVSKHE